MKYLLIILLAGIYMHGFSQSQNTLNIQAGESYKKADKELNYIYKSILIKYKSDTTFIKNLKASQKIWITFRDAEVKVKFPAKTPEYYGSVYPMCVSKYKEKLTRDRIQTLRQWIDGEVEGDVCSGSVK